MFWDGSYERIFHRGEVCIYGCQTELGSDLLICFACSFHERIPKRLVLNSINLERRLNWQWNSIVGLCLEESV